VSKLRLWSAHHPHNSFSPAEVLSRIICISNITPAVQTRHFCIEHPSITEPALRLKSLGSKLNIINVDANGLITQVAIDKIIKEKPDLVSIILANNETGVIQDLAPYAGKLRAHNITVHTMPYRH